ncbi:hypothetical protein [Corynebacterium pilosum]|uniref:hypothetical protein n=1 Tax=Corynebacterium pilosum TaxID=35756 RepID=UPI00137938D2|nr:hypothetical protein [Corynebacterium pilosum]
MRKLTRRTLPDLERFERLRQVSLAKPAGPLRTQAVERAALVRAHTKVSAATPDLKAVRVIARFLYDEAVIDGVVDEERALTRAHVDHWLYQSNQFSLRSVRTYRSILYDAGRVLYPREFPAPRAVLAPRGRATPACPPGTAQRLYEEATLVPDVLRPRLLLVLDLITGAGLRSSEVREATGGDISTVSLGSGQEVVTVKVRKAGVIDRVVPVTDPRKGHRLQMRAREVGTGTLYPLTVNGVVSKNAVSRLNDRLREYGFAGLDAVSLRNRWILDLAATPGVSTAALLKLAGIGDLRVLADQAALLPALSAADLAEMLLDADEVTM